MGLQNLKGSWWLFCRACKWQTKDDRTAAPSKCHCGQPLYIATFSYDDWAKYAAGLLGGIYCVADLMQRKVDK